MAHYITQILSETVSSSYSALGCYYIIEWKWYTDLDSRFGWSLSFLCNSGQGSDPTFFHRAFSFTGKLFYISDCWTCKTYILYCMHFKMFIETDHIWSASQENISVPVCCHASTHMVILMLGNTETTGTHVANFVLFKRLSWPETKTKVLLLPSKKILQYTVPIQMSKYE